jgi:hypothetical protein
MMGLGDRGSEMVENICRVCGLDEGEDRWTGPDGAQYIICPCCGAESGVEDIRLDWVRTYRARWINEGCIWRFPEERPEEWQLDRQISQVPAVWN